MTFKIAKKTLLFSQIIDIVIRIIIQKLDN